MIRRLTNTAQKTIGFTHACYNDNSWIYGSNAFDVEMNIFERKRIRNFFCRFFLTLFRRNDNFDVFFFGFDFINELGEFRLTKFYCNSIAYKKCPVFYEIVFFPFHIRFFFLKKKGKKKVSHLKSSTAYIYIFNFSMQTFHFIVIICKLEQIAASLNFRPHQQNQRFTNKFNVK